MTAATYSPDELHRRARARYSNARRYVMPHAAWRVDAVDRLRAPTPEGHDRLAFNVNQLVAFVDTLGRSQERDARRLAGEVCRHFGLVKR